MEGQGSFINPVDMSEEGGGGGCQMSMLQRGREGQKVQNSVHVVYGQPKIRILIHFYGNTKRNILYKKEQQQRIK